MNDMSVAVEDVQNRADHRRIAIDQVGVRGLRYPLSVAGRDGREQQTVADCALYVELPHQFKGTHMSRFVEVLHDLGEPLCARALPRLLQRMTERLEARRGHVEFAFPFFMEKRAPVSGVASLMDYRVAFTGAWHDGRASIGVRVEVPLTSLCPCSKSISRYGAHNQRSRVSVSAQLADFLWVEELIELVEAEGSCDLYGLLKRPDEKYVTERAYDNPKFVEDLVRDVAVRMDALTQVTAYTVEAENFESIHNHSAYARIER